MKNLKIHRQCCVQKDIHEKGARKATKENTAFCVNVSSGKLLEFMMNALIWF